MNTNYQVVVYEIISKDSGFGYCLMFLSDQLLLETSHEVGITTTLDVRILDDVLKHRIEAILE